MSEQCVKEYLEKYDIESLMHILLEFVACHMPDDPYDSLARYCRAVSEDTIERDKQVGELKDRLDDPNARDRVVALQREMFALVFKTDALGAPTDAASARMAAIQSELAAVVKTEVRRLGELTAARTSYYSIMKVRWEMLGLVKMETSKPPIQPGGGGHGIAPLLQQSTLVARASAKLLLPYFKHSLQAIVDELNGSEGGVKTDAGPPFAPLPFLSHNRIRGLHATLMFGPIKDVARSSDKVAEYDAEIAAGTKPSMHEGRRLSGISYVLDWLRATVSAEDPYVLVVFFLRLRRCKAFSVLRVKNKIAHPAPTDGANIRTNVLINLILKYPASEAEYDAASLTILGPFDSSLAGKELMACEVQLTLGDFVTIKRLMHAYYDLERSADPNFVLQSPVFVDEGLQPKTPSVMIELQQAAEAAEAVEAAVAAAETAETAVAAEAAAGAAGVAEAAEAADGSPSGTAKSEEAVTVT